MESQFNYFSSCRRWNVLQEKGKCLSVFLLPNSHLFAKFPLEIRLKKKINKLHFWQFVTKNGRKTCEGAGWDKLYALTSIRRLREDSQLLSVRHSDLDAWTLTSSLVPLTALFKSLTFCAFLFLSQQQQLVGVNTSVSIKMNAYPLVSPRQAAIYPLVFDSW